jgi:quinol monooxygenase YgiN
VPYCLIARIHPNPEHFAAARNAIVQILPATHAEAGCLRFDLFEGAEDGCLYIVEAWRDRAAFDHHHAQPYTRDVFEHYGRWLAEPVTLTQVRPV